MEPMSIFDPRSWKQFTSATDLLDWRPVNARGEDEPRAVFDPLVWRALLDADETPPRRARTRTRGPATPDGAS